MSKQWSAAIMCGAALGALMVSSAQAASAQVQETNLDPVAEEIVVTARKRQESILNVPVVMTAVTQEQLEAYATNDLISVANRVPGLLVGASLAANGLQVSMRGIGTTANNATVDNSISLNIDGLQLSQGLAYGLGMFDVGQVEVLKGPQALFFGKNSPAGVISLRSADPSDLAEVIGRLGYEFEARERVGELILSGPVSDSLKLRFAVRFSDQDGFFRNTVQALPGTGSVNPTNRRVTPTEDLMLRATALYRPNAGYNARLKLSYQDQDQQGTWPALQPRYCPEGTGGVPPLNIQFIGGDCKMNRDMYAAWPDPIAFSGLRNNGKPFNHLKQALASLEQNIELGNALTLTSVSGFYTVSQEYLYLAAMGTAIPLVSDSDFASDQWTQELRLASDYAGPVNFVAGAFYQNAGQTTDVLLKGNPALGFPAVSQSNRHKIGIESWSAFGQLIWKITPELEFAPGARWTREKRDHRQYNYLPASGPVGRSTLLDPYVSSNNVSPEVTLTYRPRDDLTVYAAYKTGYKSGSFNGTIYASPTTPASFGDEQAKGGEVGVKSRLFDRQLAMNATAYYYRYSDLQVGAGEIRGAVIINRTLNAASANVYGLDFDAAYAPAAAPGLSVQTAVNYNQAYYTSFPNAPCGNGQTISQGCDQLLNPTTGRFSAQDMKGRDLVRAPAWMATLGADYERSITDDLVLHLGAYASYSSKYSLNLTDLPGFYQPEYIKANATVTLRGANDAWEVSLIGNNLTNEITSANCFNSNLQNGSFFGGQIQGGPLPGPAGGDEANCVAERGREVWVRFTVRPSVWSGHTR
ncbi:TonB-dependent receptor [Phenylobacterium sp. LjRoot219]|uniref:TonB-dependent receptor n=1 Tax=Phenylobacterium sp. LjRoot219 TaxID=3342283 RepID=UPI003ECF2C42